MSVLDTLTDLVQKRGFVVRLERSHDNDHMLLSLNKLHGIGNIFESVCVSYRRLQELNGSGAYLGGDALFDKTILILADKIDASIRKL